MGALISTIAVVAGVLSPLPALAASHTHSPALRTVHGVTLNWSGYAVSGSAPYTSVSATWTQPAVNCAKTPTAFSSFWVGLDGLKTPTVEQTGVEAGCFEGTPIYFAWYELYPKGSGATPFPRKDVVSPGDTFTATVTDLGKSKFRMTLSDATRGWSRTVTKADKKAELGSAEVIAEAPSRGTEILPLADFGTVSFSGVSIDGTPLSGSTPGLEPITMASSGHVTEAEPAPLAGSGFSDTWYSE
jgi:hypothetical protein